MENIRKELKEVMKCNLVGNIENKRGEERINLYKLDAEIRKVREIRNYIIRLFEQDSLRKIKRMNLPYIKEINYPIIIDYKRLFEGDLLSLKVFTNKYIYASTKVGDRGLVDTDIKSYDINIIISEITKYIEGLFRIRENCNILDNSFYDEADIMLYYKYLQKLIVSGDGVKLPIASYKLDSHERCELLRFYYDNLKMILKRIEISDSEKLDNYRTNINKRKLLELYRG